MSAAEEAVRAQAVVCTSAHRNEVAADRVEAAVLDLLGRGWIHGQRQCLGSTATAHIVTHLVLGMVYIDVR